MYVYLKLNIITYKCSIADNGLIGSNSSQKTDLLSPFNEQTCQMENSDWYKEDRVSTNTDAANFCGLLAPYFEVGSF